MAYFLAILGMGEYKYLKRAKDILGKAIDLGIQEILTFNDPIASTARLVLSQTNKTLLTDIFVEILNSTDNKYLIPI